MQLVRLFSHGPARVSRQTLEHGERMPGVQKLHVRFRDAGENVTVRTFNAHVLLRNVHEALLHLSALPQISGRFHRLLSNARRDFSGRAKENPKS